MAQQSNNSNSTEASARRALIVDDDESILHATAKALATCNFNDIASFTTGEDAWKSLEANDFDMVVLDWKMAKVSGSALLNRMRRLQRHTFTPALVVSGFLTPQDFRLIEEFPFTAFLEKPFALPLFQYKVKDLLAQATWFKSKQSEIENIFSRLQSKPGSAVQDVKTLIKNAPKPLPLVLAAAKLLVQYQKLSDAESLLLDYLRTDPECPSALTLLGKVYLMQQRPDSAAKVLIKAQSHTPSNLERLCLLGDANLQVLNMSEAATHFSAALAIDGEDIKASAGKSLASSMESYMSLPSTTSIPNSFAGMLNAVGISYVRTERVDEGIRYYEQAMSYVEDAWVRSKLSFNIGLGFVRAHQPDKATPWFRQAATLSGGQLLKAVEYLKKLDKHLGKGSEVMSPTAGPVNVFFEDDGIPNVAPTTTPAATPTAATAPTVAAAMSAQPPPPVEPSVAKPPAPTMGAFGAIDTEDEDSFDFSQTFKSGGDGINLENISLPVAKIEDELLYDKKLLAQNAAGTFEALKPVISNLRMPDDSLFSRTGKQQMRKQFEAYAARIGAERIAVFLPKTMSPVQFARLSEEEARREQILILKAVGQKFEPYWPPPAPAPAKASGE